MCHDDFIDILWLYQNHFIRKLKFPLLGKHTHKSLKLNFNILHDRWGREDPPWLYRILKFKDSCVYFFLVFKDLCVYFFLVESNIFETHGVTLHLADVILSASSQRRREPVHPWELKFSPPYGEDSEARCRLCRRLPESAVLASSAFAKPKDSRHGRLEKSVGSFLQEPRTADSLEWKKLPLEKKGGRSLSCLPVEATKWIFIPSISSETGKPRRRPTVRFFILNGSTFIINFIQMNQSNFM